MTAIDDIAAERRRQIEAEGWTVEHDDEHGFGDMANAAAVYAMTHTARSLCVDSHNPSRTLGSALWPWDWKFWKPKARRHDLVRAGALIVAEIERLDRAAAKRTPQESE
jgi:hypothetical protein